MKISLTDTAVSANKNHIFALKYY